MYTYISDHLFLRQEKEFAICFDERPDYCLSYLYKISLEDFFPLTLFNSWITSQEIASILDQSGYGNRCGVDWINYLTERYSDILSTSSERGARSHILVTNKNLGAYPTCDAPNKLAFPIMVSIRLNNYCDSKCVYCFNRSNRSLHSQLDYEDFKSVVLQLQYGGVTTLNITGVDPFCHPDIYKILDLLVSLNFYFNISTKRILDKDEISQLVEVGVKRIQISIDSSDDAINEKLIHREQYFYKQKKVIQELVRCGFEVEVNSVINALNINTIGCLLVALNDLGVKRLTLTPYLSVNPYLDSYLMTTETQITNLWKDLKQYNGLSIIWDFAIPEQDIAHSYYGGEHNICSGGRMSLVINHDGCVTLCERLVDNSAFSVGNILKSKFIEIWNGEKLLELTHPCPQQFYGTQCYSCNNFDKCITQKGPCYARIAKVSSRKFDCDPFCDQALKKVRFH